MTDTGAAHQERDSHPVGRMPWADFAAHVMDHAPEVRADIEKLAAKHGPLSDDVIRTALMARYCCIYHDDFPHNFLDCCRAIGRLSPLPLRLCLQISPALWEAGHGYMAGVRAWLDGVEPRRYARALALDDSMPAWIHSLLDVHGPVKDALAQRALAVLVGQFYHTVRFMIVADPDDEVAGITYRSFDSLVHRADGVHYASLLDKDGRPTEPPLPNSPEAEEIDLHLSMERPPCAQKVFRYWEIILSSIGVMRWRGAVPGGGRSREDYEQEFAAHLSAAAEWAGGHKHFTHEGAEVAGALGEWTPLKHDLVNGFLLQPPPEPGLYDFLFKAGTAAGLAPAVD